jgi:uncharacterized protein involved in cysteine biosynthesis
MLSALLLSLGQLGDPRFLRVLGKSLALTLALLATLGVALWFAARAAAERWLTAGEGMSAIIGVAALLGGVMLAWLIWRALAVAVVGMFADEVVEAVEARHYPQALKTARPVPFARSVTMGAGSAARALLVNLAASPIYLALLVTGVGTAAAFFLVNALLLGRDLGDMVAARHVARAQLPAFRAATRLPRLALGGVGTVLLLVPVLNLVAPLIGAAMATHMFHRRSAR